MTALSDTPFLRWMIFAFTSIVFLTVSVASGYAWYADHLAESNEPADWLHAAQLEPGNGEYWYKLGFNRQWDLNDSDASQVITYLRRAVTIDPRSANYWMALAGAYESAGQIQQARDSFHTALQDYPASAEAHWRFGSFLLRQGETKQAYAEIHFALQNDSRLIPLAISRVWPATHDADALLNDVLPKSEESQQEALEAFSTDNQIEPALAVWEYMVKSGESIPIKTVFPLEQILLDAKRTDEARDVWRQALVASGKPEEANTGSSIIFNGGFEYDASGGGLDWRLVPIPGLNYDYDTANPHSGKRSLRLNFDGEQNPDLQIVSQYVAVQPNTRYRFEGYIHTSGITTESGLRFFIAFAGTALPPLILQNFTGDHPWEKQSADFTTAPDEHLLLLQLLRPKSVRFNSNLAGSAWVDDISIVPAGHSLPNP
jgi:tetratricopeptide (TPR) repeat protein